MAANRGLLTLRVLYFLYFGALGGYWTYLNVYYREIGLSGTQIGIVNTVAPLVSIFAATMWGLVNDRLGRPRLLLRITIPGVIAACLGLSMVQNFYLIILFACLMSFFISATIPLLDNTTLRLLGEHRNRYGRYRVTGTLGFIFTSLASGYLYEITGLHTIFYTYIVVMALFLAAASFLPNERLNLASPVRGGLGKMISQPAWMVFAASALLLWISNTGAMNFIGITVKEMGGTESLIGIVWMASAITEIPILLASERLLRRFGSTLLLLVALTIFTLRSVLLALMPSPEWAIWISSLGGLSFSLYWVASVSYANEAAPDHLKSTAQGLLFSIMNLGMVAGSFSSGWIFDNLGFRGLFWLTALFAGAGMLLFLAGRYVLSRRTTHRQEAAG
jgi:MFS transporter, PPP family, 3-phenylpropionic acid transporter